MHGCAHRFGEPVSDLLRDLALVRRGGKETRADGDGRAHLYFDDYIFQRALYMFIFSIKDFQNNLATLDKAGFYLVEVIQ